MTDPAAPPDPPAPHSAPSAGRHGGVLGHLRRAWPWARYVVGLGLGALAVWALLGRRGELSGASAYLAHTRWAWALLAAILELASIVAFALVQEDLLAAGDVTVNPGWITGLTLAVTAIANSMPAGPIVSSVFAYRQYRRRGADEALAGWTLAAVFVAASVSLAVVAAVGVGIAGAEGASFDLVGVTIGVLVLTLVMGAVFVNHRALDWLVEAALRATRRLTHWPRGDLGDYVDHIVARVEAVRLGPLNALRVMAWALLNWILDCGCLAICFWAVGSGVPWRGLLLAYGAGQLAANLPITPGGLGVVEGSLTIALVAFGGAETSTVAAVLLYRIMSFWGELPVGWAIWGTLAWQTRREQALSRSAKREGDVAEVMA